MQLSDLNVLNSHRDLLFAWSKRILRARYKQSFLGFFWALIQPAANVIIFTILFTLVIPIQTDQPYLLFAFVAMVPWTFFTASLNDMVNSLVDNMNLVTKIYFPREVLPLAALIARSVDFFLAGIMLIPLMIYFHAPFFPPSLFFLPLIFLVQAAFGLGLGFIAAALNVFYRDIRHIVTLALQLWFYLTPIIYPIDRIPEAYQSLYFLNPMTGIILAYRDVLLNAQIPDVTLLISAGIAAGILVFGYRFFKRVEFQFADVV
jgi:ABC-type polysaccharide/polyol phosphate export permease